MASMLIHMAVAKKVNEKLKLDEKYFLLGSIAPDIGKDINIPKEISHFQKENETYPDCELFLKKYKNKLDKPFEIGYYVHLLTDYIWFKEFLPNYENDGIYILKNGVQVNVTAKEFANLIYNDYTNLNKKIIDYYELDLAIFYEEYPLPEIEIEEIPQDKLRYLIDKVSLICAQDYSHKEWVLTLENISHFIEYVTIYILDELKKIGIK